MLSKHYLHQMESLAIAAQLFFITKSTTKPNQTDLLKVFAQKLE